MNNQSEVRDGMRIDWDVPITMDDDLVLRADIYRPPQEGKYPVILSYGPYAKGLAFQEGYPDQWQRMAAQHPDVTEGSTNKYQNWEVVDPEKWVEVVFQGALDPHTPIGQGWLRASHRKLDPVLSTEYRPYHTHDVRESLIPGKVYELEDAARSSITIPMTDPKPYLAGGTPFSQAAETHPLCSCRSFPRGAGKLFFSVDKAFQAYYEWSQIGQTI